jgi:putative ABC transport system permease protein
LGESVPRPPRRVEGWLRRVLATSRAADEILGDLREEYVRLHANRGAAPAALWYVFEVTRLAAQVGGRHGIEGLTGDVRHAFRSLSRSPGFAGVAVLTLAIGLGANTALFAVLRAVVLAPLPFAEPEELVTLQTVDVRNGARGGAFSFPQFEDFLEQQRAYTGIAAFKTLEPTWTREEGQPPRRLTAIAATHDLLPLLGVAPLLGRGIAPEEDVVGGPPVAVISHAFWVGSLGGDAHILSRHLRLDGVPYAVVGVLPPGFRGETDGGWTIPSADADVWMGYRNSPAAEGMGFRGLSNVPVVARLAPGVTVDEARADGERIMAGLREEFREHANAGVAVLPAREVLVGPVSSTLFLLFGAAALVLLIACTNVAGLVLGRASGRTREIALRSALGAGRTRLVRLLLAEAAVLALAGGVAGVGITAAVLRLVRSMDPGSIPRLDGSALDAATTLFLACGAVVVVAILGLVPLAYVRPRELGATLRDGGRSTDSGRRASLRKGLVVAQVALASVLLLGAGVFVRSLNAALRVDPGFDPEGVLTARVVMPDPYISANWPEHVRFFGDLVARLRETPGVRAAAAGLWDPADPGWNNSFRFAGRPEPEPGAQPSAEFRPVTPGYFATARIPVLAGRTFDAADDTEAPGVAIVNEAFVRRYLTAADPLGQVLDYGDFWNAREDPEYRIVGVVGDQRTNGVTAAVTPVIYFPHAQQPVREMAVMVRTDGDPLALADDLRRVVAELDSRLPVDGVTTMHGKLARSLAGRRFTTSLLGLFAAAALLLATVGLYGVLSFLVAQRTHEIGVRMALGAAGGRVVRQVLREGLGLVGLGLTVGIPAALFLGRAAERLLFTVTAADPLTAFAVPALLLAVGAATCWTPARRATRVDPLRALRSE